MVWPKVCARCGSTNAEDLHGERVTILRQKTEKVGMVGHRYRTYDVAMHAHIFLCSKCESIATREFNQIHPRRKMMTWLLLVMSIGLTAVPMPIVLITNAGSAAFLAALFVGIQFGGITWSLLFSTKGSELQLDQSGPRRFFVDWTLNGPIRFTNEVLMQAFRAVNPDVKVKRARNISRWPIEMPSCDDCQAGCCLSIIIVCAFILVQSLATGG